MMKERVSRTIVAAAIGLSVALAVPAVAGADSSHRSADSYRTAVKVIDHQFLAAVAAAKHQLDVALSHAATPGQRNTARARYSLAIALASTERDKELVDLGEPPKSSGASVTTTVARHRGD
jgi:hypothetical protein